MSLLTVPDFATAGAIGSQAMPDSPQRLPAGVLVLDPSLYADNRGYLVEVYSKEEFGGLDFVQWNLAHDVTRSLRGVHVHLRHTDYLVVAAGRYVAGLHDMRPDSPTQGLSALVRLDAERGHRGVLIPPGVAHGFYCVSEGSLVYGMTHRWDVTDDLGCQWNDPGHGLRFPAIDPVQSPRDIAAGSYEAMRAQYLEQRI